MHLFAIFALVTTVSAQVRPTTCGIGRRAEATATTLATVVATFPTSSTVNFPYPTMLAGRITNVTGHGYDGRKVIDWDDEWWPILTPAELDGLGANPSLLDFGADNDDYGSDDEDDNYSPATNNSTHADANNLAKRTSARQCGTYQYSASSATAAYNAAVQHLNAGTQVRGSNNVLYPHYFGGYTTPQITWPFSPCNVNGNRCVPKNLYPILRNGRLFATNANPSTDRTVAVYYAAGNVLRFGMCGLMTHDGAQNPPRNNFKLCV